MLFLIPAIPGLTVGMSSLAAGPQCKPSRWAPPGRLDVGNPWGNPFGKMNSTVTMYKVVGKQVNTTSMFLRVSLQGHCNLCQPTKLETYIHI